MINLNLKGGLGNQMFQYAFALSIAEETNKKITFDDRFSNQHNGFELGKAFGIKPSKPDATEIVKLKISNFKKNQIIKFCSKKNQFIKNFLLKNSLIEEKLSYQKYKVHSDSKILFIDGYWQSALYFKSIEKMIKEKFEFPPLPELEKNKYGIDILETNSVSIHIRRGDYLNEKNKKIYCICGEDYYSKSISHILRKVNNPKFYIFSDDVEWAKKNIKFNQLTTYIIKEKSHISYIDMQLMSMCKHNIIANSSFSWWAAWLNKNQEKIVIAPKKWFINKDLNLQSRTIIPATWEKL